MLSRTDRHQLAFVGDVKRIEAQQFPCPLYRIGNRYGGFSDQHTDARSLGDFVKHCRQAATGSIAHYLQARHGFGQALGHGVQGGAVRFKFRAEVQPFAGRQDGQAMIADGAADQHGVTGTSLFAG